MLREQDVSTQSGRSEITLFQTDLIYPGSVQGAEINSIVLLAHNQDHVTFIKSIFLYFLKNESLKCKSSHKIYSILLYYS